MPFIAPDRLNRTELFPGAMSGLVSGEHIMLSFLEMAEGAKVPEHAHPEEQAGIMLQGRLRLKIGDEEKVMAKGDAYIIPPNVTHSGMVEEGPMRIMDVFGPPRGDYLAKISEED